MKKQTLHQLNRIVYIDEEFEPSTTYEFAPAIVTNDEPWVYVYHQSLSTALSNLGFEWFYAYNYARYGTGATARYSVYCGSVGGLLIDNTEITFEPNYVATIGSAIPRVSFASLGIIKVELSNDGGATWTEETSQNAAYVGLRVVSGVQYLTVRHTNNTSLSGVNKVRFTFSTPVNRLYFALYNECKEG